MKNHDKYSLATLRHMSRAFLPVHLEVTKGSLSHVAAPGSLIHVADEMAVGVLLSVVQMHHVGLHEPLEDRVGQIPDDEGGGMRTP